MRRYKATVDETLVIEEKRQRKVNAIYEVSLAVSRDPILGYQPMRANL